MKKTLWIAMAGAFAASVVAASAQEVLSENAVGYIKKTLPAAKAGVGQFIMAAIPLNSMTEASNVFGRTSIAQETPQESYVYFWNVPLQQWDSGKKGTKGWAGAQSNHVVLAGEGFFLQGPPLTNYPVDVTITGEVPEEDPVSRAIPGGNAFGAVANPYPVDFKFGESALAKAATSNSYVYFWNTELQQWDSGKKGSKGWAGAQSNRVVLAGEGFFMQEFADVTTWTNVKPYTWP